MLPRVGSNGAVIKRFSSTKSHRNVRPRKVSVIDLTPNSTGETSENKSRGESTEENESEDLPERRIRQPNVGRGYQTSSAGRQERSSGAGQAGVGQKESNKLLQV